MNDHPKAILAISRDRINGDRVSAQVEQVLRVLFARGVRVCFGRH
jgi:hypothetical protein